MRESTVAQVDVVRNPAAVSVMREAYGKKVMIQTAVNSAVGRARQAAHDADTGGFHRRNKLTVKKCPWCQHDIASATIDLNDDGE